MEAAGCSPRVGCLAVIFLMALARLLVTFRRARSAGGAGFAGAAGEAGGAGELAGEGVDLGFGAGGVVDVVAVLRVLELLGEVLKALLVGGAGVGVDQLARVAEAVLLDAAELEGVDLGAGAAERGGAAEERRDAVEELKARVLVVRDGARHDVGQALAYRR
jgi:hypothetical protein